MPAERAYAALPRAIAAQLMPRQPMTVSQWADKYRIVPPGTSPEPGPWRTARAPYLREILDACSDPLVETVVLMTASQVGKTEILLCVMGYFADQEPAPMLLVYPTEQAVRGFSKERVSPMFTASPALRGKLSETAKDPTNVVLDRKFAGGFIAMAWSGSAASLASRPIRVVLGDELDRWKDETGKDGDPWAQAIQRTSNFHNRKKIAVSTPLEAGTSRIEALYEATDRRKYYVPCPHCAAFQVLAWSEVIYKTDHGEIDLDDVHYRCMECHGRIYEYHRAAMVGAGEWRAEFPEVTERGYQISALYSPWVRWRELAVEWIKANAERNHVGLKEFVNLRLGETWTETLERITVDELEKNREHYVAALPDGVLMLTASVDVQDNRLEVEIVGWGVGRESWGIRYEVIAGSPAVAGVWEKLDAFLARSWEKEDGRALALWCVFIDSGGHHTDEVYKYCQRNVARNIFAIKGHGGMGVPLVGKPTTSNAKRVLLFPLGVDTGKETVFARLAIPMPGPGYCHFPVADGYDGDYFKGLLSEKRVRRTRNGATTFHWVKTRPRNEPLDARVYATAAMEHCSPDFDALALADAKSRKPIPSGGGAPVTPIARRRILSRGVE